MTAPEITYLFIDAGYLSEALIDLSKKWFNNIPIELDYPALQQKHSKVFFYDCLPARKEDESDVEYNERKRLKEELFSRLRAIDGWHVNEGIAKHRKRQGAQQKEVDILIAVDMLAHAYRKNIRRLTFIAGDQDFCPLIEAVVREGMYIELWYEQSSISNDLRNSADSTRPIGLDLIWQLSTAKFKSSNPIPTSSTSDTAEPRYQSALVEVGMQAGVRRAQLFQSREGYEVVSTESSGSRHEHSYYYEPQYLKRVHEMRFGLTPLTWQASNHSS